ncbi:hypothetical protein CUMW_278020 [Citrus unshiu]|uniref:Uncharacterized protein n=1 Tax=Citrus unshiu TaxID=55188 RepID=A0A2H5N5P6_CITUN|nr:hypothetical protein CUMW_278020 [Citrus unshiu]
MGRPETSTSQRNIPTRDIYRADTHPQRAGTRSHRIMIVALFLEPLRETRDPTFAHNVAVRVP